MAETTSFLFDVLKTQWLIVALGSGVILLFLAILLYLAVWRPREKVAGERKGTEGGWSHAFRHVPFILILTYVASILFAIGFSVYTSNNPPNW